MLGRTLRGLVSCSAVLAAAGLALAGERRVPSDYSTIQTALNAAASGDVVVCAAVTYTEAVVATKSNITIQGAAGAVWDGGTGTGAVTCIDITGNAVVVTGFTFKNGVNHCKLQGDDCEVRDCTSADAGDTFCWIKGARPKVKDCRADRPRGRGVRCEGGSPVVDSCDVYDGYDDGICVDGDDAVVKYCRVERCDKGAFRCKGDRHEVLWSDARDCAEFGFRMEGSASFNLGNYA